MRKLLEITNVSQKIHFVSKFIVIRSVGVKLVQKTKEKILKSFFHQKPVFFNFFIKSDYPEINPSGCENCFGEDYEDWFVKGKQKLESNMHDFLNKTNKDLKMKKKGSN